MLLIRSQDKRNYVNIETVKTLTVLDGKLDGCHDVIADYGNDFWILLGRYKTTERAIEVLGSLGEVYNSLNHNCPREIKRGMTGNLIEGIAGYGFVRNGTYDMPEE